jgi:translocation and assembly module TamB
MAQRKGSAPEPNVTPNKPWQRAGLAVGTILTLTAGGLLWQGWVYATTTCRGGCQRSYLRPSTARWKLANWNISFFGGGGLALPSFPPTATDPDTIAVDSMQVQFDLLELPLRRLRPRVKLTGVEAYLDQGANGRWLMLPDREPEGDEQAPRESFITVRPAIRLNDGTLTLRPDKQTNMADPTLTLSDIQANVQLADARVADPAGSGTVVETLQIHVDARATGRQQGSFDTRGTVLLPPANAPETTQPGATAPEKGGSRTQVKLNIRTQQLQSTDLLPIIEAFLDDPLPVQFPTGTISGTADMEINNEETPFSLVGTARVEEATLITQGLPAPLEALAGDMQFTEQWFEFSGVTAAMGELTAQGEGTLDLKGDYDLWIETDPFTAEQGADLFDLAIPLETEGNFTVDLAMTGPLNQPIITTDLASQGRVAIDRVPFSAIEGRATLIGQALTFNSLRAVPVAGGRLTGTGVLQLGDPGNLSLAITGDALPVDTLARPYGLPDSVTIGPVFVEAEVNGPPSQLTTTASWRAPAGDFPARGDVRFAGNTLQLTDTFAQVAGGMVGGDATLVNGQWTADVTARDLRLTQVANGAIDGLLDADAQISGSLENFSLAGMQGQGTATATLVGGVVAGQGTLANGQWSADLQANQLQLAAFSPTLQGTGSGKFTVAGNVNDLSLGGVQGQGRLVLSDGLATVASVAPQLAAVRAPMIADLAWDGQVVQVQQASTAGIRVDGVITPQLEGTNAPRIANLDLNLAVDGYDLAALPVPNLVPVTGRANFDGRLTGSPATLTLMGNATLADLAVGELDFYPQLMGPVLFARTGGLTVDLQGGEDRIYAATQQADRDLDFLVRNGDALAEGYLQADNLYARIDNLPLDGLKLPPGGIDGIGTVSGTIDSATITANLRTPTLSATFDIVDPGIGYISLQTADVAPDNEAGAEPDTPPVAVRPPVPVDATPDLETRYGRLRGTVGYANGVFSLAGGNLESASGLSRYLLSGTYSLGEPPQVNGEMVVQNGQIQDLLLTFKIFELSDLRLTLLQPPDWFRPVTEAEVAALQPNPVGDRNASLLDQLRRLAEIRELQDLLAAQEEAAPFPPLDELTGSFSGTITAQGPLTPAIRLETNLQGRDWTWGDATRPQTAYYQVNHLLADASYEDGVVRFKPAQLSAVPPGESMDDTAALVRLNGEFSLDRNDPVARSLNLTVANVDLDTLRRPLSLPSTIDGQLNGGATLTGSLDNPQIRGQLEVADATINRNAVDQASATFIYQDARLKLLGGLTVDDAQADPLTLTASIPYQLPVATRPPDNQDVAVDLAVENEGFAVLNLLTPTFTWESGEARMNLAVRGTIPQDENLTEAITSLSVGGAASLRGVTISSTILPEPLTNIRGDIRVVNDSGTSLTRSVYGSGLALAFDNVRGDFSDGEVVATGNLSILPSINELFPGVVDTTADGPPPAPPAPEEAPPTPGTGAEAATAAIVPDGEDPAVASEPTPATATPAPSAPPVAPIAAAPFQLTLTNIDLALQQLYKGQVNGNVVVDGSLFLLEPEVKGEILLTNGVISLPETTEGQGSGSLLGNGGSGEVSLYRPQPPTLTDFRISLGDNVRIVVPGLLDVRSEGSLALVGTVPDVRPDGRINLPDGRINLLTTAFRLSGNDNYAEFRATDTTIDPYLVASLVSTVSDSTGSGTALSIASPFPRNEISDAELNQLGLTQSGVESVRIRADVAGRVSRVTQLQGVELSSSPPVPKAKLSR